MTDQVPNLTDEMPNVTDQVPNVTDEMPNLSNQDQVPNVTDQVPTVMVRCMIKCPTTRRSCPKDTHRSLTLASFAPTHDLQKIFWGGQNKPAVFSPNGGV